MLRDKRQQRHRRGDGERDAEHQQQGARRPPQQVAVGKQSHRQLHRLARRRGFVDLAVLELDLPSASAARPSSCVTSTSVMPASARSRQQQLDDRRCVLAVEIAGRLVRQSSSSGRLARLRAIATRWRSPPDSANGKMTRAAAEGRPDRAARPRACAGPAAASPVPLIAISTFSIARRASAAAGTPGKRCRSCLRRSVVHARRSLTSSALPQHAAAGWPVEPGHDVDEAGLAAAARTDDRRRTRRAAIAMSMPRKRHDRAVVEDRG